MTIELSNSLIDSYKRIKEDHEVEILLNDLLNKIRFIRNYTDRTYEFPIFGSEKLLRSIIKRSLCIYGRDLEFTSTWDLCIVFYTSKRILSLSVAKEPYLHSEFIGSYFSCPLFGTEEELTNFFSTLKTLF